MFSLFKHINKIPPLMEMYFPKLGSAPLMGI